MTARPNDLEIAHAICCGKLCRTDTTHCHANDHFAEAYRVRKLLDHYEFGSESDGSGWGSAAAARGGKPPTNRAPKPGGSRKKGKRP